MIPQGQLVSQGQLVPQAQVAIMDIGPLNAPPMAKTLMLAQVGVWTSVPPLSVSKSFSSGPLNTKEITVHPHLSASFLIISVTLFLTPSSTLWTFLYCAGQALHT